MIVASGHRGGGHGDVDTGRQLGDWDAKPTSKVVYVCSHVCISVCTWPRV